LIDAAATIEAVGAAPTEWATRPIDGQAQAHIGGLKSGWALYRSELDPERPDREPNTYDDAGCLRRFEPPLERALDGRFTKSPFEFGTCGASGHSHDVDFRDVSFLVDEDAKLYGTLQTEPFGEL
jgi:hypothetical protein